MDRIIELGTFSKEDTISDTDWIVINLQQCICAVHIAKRRLLKVFVD